MDQSCSSTMRRRWSSIRPTGERRSKRLPAACPCPVEWHPGIQLTIDELRRHPAYRGQEYVDLGAEIAVDELLDPRIIGDAGGTDR